jgi:hypothetical protein
MSNKKFRSFLLVLGLLQLLVGSSATRDSVESEFSRSTRCGVSGEELEPEGSLDALTTTPAGKNPDAT